MTDEEIADDLQANYIRSNRDLAEHAPRGEYSEIDGLAIKYVGVAAHGENGAFVIRPLRDPESAITAAIDYFVEREVPFGILMREGLDPASEQVCADLGLLLVRRHPGMALAPIPSEMPPPPPELDIHVVTTPAEHEVHVQTDAAGFEGDVELTRQVFAASLIERPYAVEFLGYLDGTPVATSVLVMTGRTAGVYGVATIPSHRRRGYGEAMTWRTIAEGASRGCEIAGLQASDEGLPLYERMGFRLVAPFLIFAKP